MWRWVNMRSPNNQKPGWLSWSGSNVFKRWWWDYPWIVIQYMTYIYTGLYGALSGHTTKQYDDSMIEWFPKHRPHGCCNFCTEKYPVWGWVILHLSRISPNTNVLRVQDTVWISHLLFSFIFQTSSQISTMGNYTHFKFHVICRYNFMKLVETHPNRCSMSLILIDKPGGSITGFFGIV